MQLFLNKNKIKTINDVASEVKLFMNNELNKSTKRQSWAYNVHKRIIHTDTYQVNADY